MATNLKISQLTPATGVNTSDYTILVDGVTAANKRATVAQIMTAAGGGTVTSVGISVANGISVSGSPITSSGSITLGLGALTPTSVAASGAVSGSNLSGTNTGDQTITLTSDVTGSGTGSFAATIAAGAVTNAKLDSMTGPTVKGRSSGSGAPSDLSMATLNGMLPNMVGDTGSGGTAGLVPAPASGDAAAKKFLTAGALWTAPDLNDLTPSQSGNSGKVLSTNGSTTSWVAAGVGSVTSVSVVSSGGVSGSVASSTTTPAISLTLGAITPSSVNSVVVSGTSTPTLAVTGTSSISNANTGDQTTITGNAGTATALQTARAINGVNFDGTAAITVTAAGSTLSDTVTIAKGGTGQITAQAAINALLPSQAGASGKNLQSDGTNVSFVADAGGTVTSVAATAGTGISVSGSPITTSGTLTITNTAPDQTVAIAAGTGISVSGTYPSFTVTNSSPSSGGTVTSVAATVPSVFSISGSPITGAGTLAMTYSGTALPVLNGGTGVTTSTGTTNVVLSASPTITTPTLTLAGVGIATSASTNLNILGSTTTVSSLRIIPGTAPTSPTNGDVWSTSTGAFIRINNTTYQFGSLP